tara:strand:- start:68 stop:1468 length:1401 start_codon:yes stop_codon:yes gene_type:complete
MATLQKKDFFESGKDKIASAGKYSGKSRKQIILEKIKNKEPFSIGNTTGGSKVIGTSLDDTSFPFILSTKSSGDIAITKLFKDPDFGGGAGSGGGAEDTKITESGQCYYTSLVFNVIKRPLKKTDYTTANLKKAAKFVQATIKLEEFLKKGPQDWFDNDIYGRTANLIYQKYARKFKGPVYCHRGSQFMDNVYKAKALVMKTDKFSAPGSFSNDKWNPGDIWLSSLAPSSKPFDKAETWAELNQMILESAGELNTSKGTTTLGVSLKKLGVKGKVDTYNSAKRKHNVSVKFKNFTFGKSGDFFSSIDVYIRFDVAEVQLRAFNSTSAWQGEIKGLAAAGGKIGGGNLNYYLEKDAKKSIGYPGDNRPKGKSWSETPASKVDINKMYALYVKFNKIQTAKIPTVSLSEFKKRLKEKGASFQFSKNMCLMFLNSFVDSSPIIRNKISTEIVRYAASNTEISSFYIKVN